MLKGIKKSVLCLALVVIFTASLTIQSPATESLNANVETRPVIIDTDFASDADDVVALELATIMQDKGLIDIKGIALSTTYSRSPMAISALLRQNKHSNIPIAMDTSNGVQVATKYVDAIYESGYSEYISPVSLYRKILANSNEKVSIITLGFLQNIEDLLKSGPDNYSSLTGAELVAEKVDTMYVVGGNLDGRPSFNFYWGTGRSTTDAAQYVNKTFPGRIVYFTEEMGNDVFCGGFYAKEDARQSNLITKALTSNNQQYGVVAWDPFAVFVAVQDMYDVLDEYDIGIENGSSYISDTGAFSWTKTDIENSLRQIFTKSRYGGEYNQYLNGMLHSKFVEENN